MERIAKKGLILAACLVLGACWTSQKLLLDESRGQAVLRDGVYQSDGPDKTRVVSKGHGWYVISDGSETPDKAKEGSMPLFVARAPASAGPNAYLFAAGAHECLDDTKTCENWTYGLIAIDKGVIRVAFPDCAKTGDLARKWEATVKGSATSECVFTGADAVNGALAEYAHQPGAFEHTYKRQ
ncbi:MAG TPA: hypothetical protein VG407_02425 [Caulobacteraceae bacterium]|nr:hypothetical protein [Caulobacteraceae bacterium]